MLVRLPLDLRLKGSLSYQDLLKVSTRSLMGPRLGEGFRRLQ